MKFLACLIPAFCVGTPQFPQTPAFSASIQYHPQTLSQNVGAGTPRFTGGQVKMDWSSQTQMWEVFYDRFAWVSPALGNLSLKQVIFHGAPTTTERNGTACGPGVSPYFMTMFSLFAQLPAAGSLDGASTVSDVACDIWTVHDDSVGNLSTCVDHEGVPRSIVVEPVGDVVGWSNVAEYSHNVTFHDIATGDDADVGSIEPLSCWLDDMMDMDHLADWVCHNPARSMQVLRALDDPEPLGVLEDRDTFDWVGQGVTLGSPTNIRFAGHKYLEVFDVDVDGRFGFWRDCNYNRNLQRNVCNYVGGIDIPSSLGWGKLVTRVSAEMLQGEKLMGACEANSLVGSWQTFPHEGKCAASAEIGDDGCTWKQKSSKVILMQCMGAFNSSGWERAWQTDYAKAPFPNVMAHVQAAVESCPDVREAINV